MSSKVRAALVAGVAIVVIVAVALVLLLGGDDQSEVTVSSDDALPSIGSLNQADDYGADVVRAYLQGAASCSQEGLRLVDELGTDGAAGMREVIDAACERSGGRPSAASVEAEIAQEELDRRGRSFWRVEDAEQLDTPFILRVAQQQGAWRVDRRCDAICDE